MNTRHALAANGVCKGVIVSGCGGGHEKGDVTGAVLRTVGVKITELGHDSQDGGLPGFWKGCAKDNVIPRFPQDKETFPEERENISDPLGASVRHTAMGVILEMGMLKLRPEERHPTAEQLIPSDSVLLVDQRAQGERKLIGIKAEVALEPALESSTENFD